VPRRRALPEGWLPGFGRAVVLTAGAGARRRRLLRSACDEAQAGGARSWILDCRFADGGPWAGVHDLFASLLPELRDRPDLVARHDYELVHVLPALQEWIKVRNPNLTDLSPPEEKVRNYPADRALRIVHGLVDLLAAWKGDSQEPWTLVCDGFDEVGHIGGIFFRELLRRRGERLRIAALAVIDPAGGARVREVLGGGLISHCVALDLPDSDPEPVDVAASALAARDLEQLVGEDRLRMQIHLPDLLRLARRGGLRDLELKWKLKALEIYNTQGLYADALVYGEDLRAAIAAAPRPVPPSLRWAMFLKLIMSYLGLGRVETAYQLAMEVARGPLMRPEWRCQLCYLIAMLHARYLPARDLPRAEGYLEEGWRALDEADELPADQLHFQRAFNRNGLAMVRHFQGRLAEAITLCLDSHARLETHLAQDLHRLHRSVLLYNLAQVYTVLGENEKAIAYLSAAIEMDPNYSEYYNDRGNIRLGQRQPIEARLDYLQAIELSPPYPEVFANLGQALRLMGRVEEAIQAYSTALDLDPGQLLPLLGRGQCHDSAGRLSDAISDYTAAIEIEPNKWDAFGLRAVARYGIGDLGAALCDLDRAIELAPEIADLYQNRAIAMADLGRTQEAERDLRTYLRLRPEADDRDEVEARLQAVAPTHAPRAEHAASVAEAPA
jgi:tetratricopeptide (TPR) repeat protein